MKSILVRVCDDCGPGSRLQASFGVARSFGAHLKWLLATFALLLAAAQAPAQVASESVWSNPKGSVHVRFHSCEQGICGTVIWANEKAKAKSARGGTSQLVGTQLFRDFRASGADGWTARVFVPDRSRTVTGTGRMVDADTFVVRGCLVKKIGCKSQTWRRIR